jgi:hypothetical protein
MALIKKTLLRFQTQQGSAIRDERHANRPSPNQPKPPTKQSPARDDTRMTRDHRATYVSSETHLAIKAQKP